MGRWGLGILMGIGSSFALQAFKNAEPFLKGFSLQSGSHWALVWLLCLGAIKLWVAKNILVVLPCCVRDCSEKPFMLIAIGLAQ